MLASVWFSQNDILFKKSDMSFEMFFVVKEIVKVFNQETMPVYVVFDPSAFFGEVGLLFNLPRTTNVRTTISSVSLFKLTKSDLDNVLIQYPQVRDNIAPEAKR